MGDFDAHTVGTSIIIDAGFFNECFLINVLLVYESEEWSSQ